MNETQNLVVATLPIVTSSTHSSNDSQNLNVIPSNAQLRARRVPNRTNSSVDSSAETLLSESRHNNNNTNNTNIQDVDELNASATTASTPSSLSSSPSVQTSTSSTTSSSSSKALLSSLERDMSDMGCNADLYFETKEECESCSFIPVSVQTLDINDFECSLCYKLFYQPVTTVCGKLSFFKEQIFFFQKSTFAVGHND